MSFYNGANNSQLIECISQIPLTFPKNSKEHIYYMNYLYYTFRLFRKKATKKYIYGNTDFTRFYHPMNTHYNKKKIEKHVLNLKRIWNNRSILFVEGENSKLGVGNDLFSNSLSIRRILCPNNNAFKKIDEIKKVIKNNCGPDDLVLIALGPTATILATELSLESRLQVIDIGHIDIVYMWFIHECRDLAAIQGKNNNEARGSHEIKIAYDEKTYSSQIIAKVL